MVPGRVVDFTRHVFSQVENRPKKELACRHLGCGKQIPTRPLFFLTNAALQQCHPRTWITCGCHSQIVSCLYFRGVVVKQQDEKSRPNFWFVVVGLVANCRQPKITVVGFNNGLLCRVDEGKEERERDREVERERLRERERD